MYITLSICLFLQEGDKPDDSLTNEKAPEEENKGVTIANLDSDAHGIVPGRKRRDTEDAADESGEYEADDVHYMEPTPRENDGKLEVAVVVKNDGKYFSN